MREGYLMRITLNEALQKGIEAHRAGKITDADRYYTAILNQNPKHPDANHNLGVLAVSLGKLQEALTLFETALYVNQKVTQYWVSYIDLLILLDRIEDAREALTNAKVNGIQGLELERLDLRLAEIKRVDKKKSVNVLEKLTLSQALELASKKISSGSSVDASKIYRDILQRFPKNSKAIAGLSIVKKHTAKDISDLPKRKKQLLMSLYKANNFSEVIHKGSEFLQHNPKSLTLHNILGASYQGLGMLDEAKQRYETVISIDPSYAEVYGNLGLIHHAQGNLDEALFAHQLCVSLKPDYASGHYNLGNVYAAQNDPEAAIAAYQKCLSIDPIYTPARLNGAELLEKWNKLEELKAWLDQIRKVETDSSPDLKYYQARYLWRTKKYDQAMSILRTLKLQEISDGRKQGFLSLTANCLDALKEFDEAYQYFSAMNDLAKESNDFITAKPGHTIKEFGKQIRAMRVMNIEPPSMAIAKSKFSPVFLVGFPRSGTTLLDTILRSHSGVQVVEEQPILQDVKLLLEKNGIADLSSYNISPEILQMAREKYEHNIQQYLERSVKSDVWIDKLPLNIFHVPWINILYPQAKFIFALRHPMDVILSCWMQNFKLNPSMVNMVDLDQTVEFYCLAMSTFKVARERYRLCVHEIKYEDLITDMKKETSALLEFLNLKWEPELENYRATAIQRGQINTPSYSQVVQPLYEKSKYRWLNYEKFLNKYLPDVEQWINHFGYR